LSKKTTGKKTTKKTEEKTTPAKPTTQRRRKKTGFLYDLDVRELLVLVVAANFFVDGIIMIILITKLYL
jgi:hypothetical protein